VSRSTAAVDTAMRIPAALDGLAELGAWVRRQTDIAAPGRTDLAERLELAVHEVATNIVRHAYGPDQRGWVDVRVAGDGRELVVTLEDSGAAFDPSRAPRPDPQRPQVGGYGLYLIEQLVDEVEYRRSAGRNRWRLTCRRIPR
jgi:anti-sigma regulatory factor (Ser/Thr protein kinase)